LRSNTLAKAAASASGSVPYIFDEQAARRRTQIPEIAHVSKLFRSFRFPIATPLTGKNPLDLARYQKT
jgi:hypothetical protein